MGKQELIEELKPENSESTVVELWSSSHRGCFISLEYQGACLAASTDNETIRVFFRVLRKKDN